MVCLILPGSNLKHSFHTEEGSNGFACGNNLSLSFPLLCVCMCGYPNIALYTTVTVVHSFCFSNMLVSKDLEKKDRFHIYATKMGNTSYVVLWDIYLFIKTYVARLPLNSLVSPGLSWTMCITPFLLPKYWDYRHTSQWLDIISFWERQSGTQTSNYFATLFKGLIFFLKKN